MMRSCFSYCVLAKNTETVKPIKYQGVLAVNSSY